MCSRPRSWPIRRTRLPALTFRSSWSFTAPPDSAPAAAPRPTSPQASSRPSSQASDGSPSRRITSVSRARRSLRLAPSLPRRRSHSDRLARCRARRDAHGRSQRTDRMRLTTSRRVWWLTGRPRHALGRSSCALLRARVRAHRLRRNRAYGRPLGPIAARCSCARRGHREPRRKPHDPGRLVQTKRLR